MKDTLSGERAPPWHPEAPGNPWTPSTATEGGRLVYHYSAPYALLPCRDVMKLADYKFKGVRAADNKSDPNLETLTFGMWSTCDQHYRSRFGTDQNRFLFFRTNWRSSQDPVITGYYEVGWTLDSWYVAPPGAKRPARVVPDRFVAAKRAHFVSEPLHLSQVARALRRPVEELKRRAVIQFSPRQALRLKEMLDEQPDSTPGYIREIRRLERRNESISKWKYVNWGRSESFDWQSAGPCVSLASRQRPTPQEQAAWAAGIEKDKWRCAGCGNEIPSPRAIKLCSNPNCTDGGRFLPILKPVCL